MKVKDNFGSEDAAWHSIESSKGFLLFYISNNNNFTNSEHCVRLTLINSNLFKNLFSHIFIVKYVGFSFKIPKYSKSSERFRIS